MHNISILRDVIFDEEGSTSTSTYIELLIEDLLTNTRLVNPSYKQVYLEIIDSLSTQVQNWTLSEPTETDPSLQVSTSNQPTTSDTVTHK